METTDKTRRHDDTPDSHGWIRVGTIDELRAQKTMVVRGADRPIAVFAHDTGFSAVDNRCPHLGFPLSRGTVQDGILTCHWHQARFDLCSGCTFDLFADDVPAFDLEVRGDLVFVRATPRVADALERYRRRLRSGLEQNIGLIQAKAIIGLLQSGMKPPEIVRQIARFGAANRDSWSGGLTSLIALSNLTGWLEPDTKYLALFQGAVRVADDCANQPPRRERPALDTNAIGFETLKRWLRHWIGARHRDGAERTIQTAIASGATSIEIGDLLYTAATERLFADGGHALDFTNKAIEALDTIGWEYAPELVPTVIGQLVSSRGGEEMSHWRYPIDLVAPLSSVDRELPNWMSAGAGKTWDNVAALAQRVLGDDPLAILDTLKNAILAGARPEQISRAVAYAAVLRVARFGTANEMGDWITVLHTFTYANAIHQAVKRNPAADVLRGVFHGAMSVYFDRFLNVPPARLPGERDADAMGELPADEAEILRQFLEALDGQQKVQTAARLVARYLALGHSASALIDTLTRATVREDANFHTIQMLEAGVAQFQEWDGQPEGDVILIAVARYVAAHSPTPRARLQTAQIALRLHRGDNLFEEEGSR